MKETARRVMHVGAACAASVVGVVFGASQSPQEMRAQSCENDACVVVDHLMGFKACQPAGGASSGCNVTGNWNCETYCCSGSCS